MNCGRIGPASPSVNRGQGGVIPDERPEDAHDILGTWRIVSDDREMHRIPADASALKALLKARHAAILGGRPDRRPGAFKQAENRAGATVFVAPDLVAGTLAQGLGLCRAGQDFPLAAFLRWPRLSACRARRPHTMVPKFQHSLALGPRSPQRTQWRFHRPWRYTRAV